MEIEATMKRLLSTLSLLLTSVAAWAQFDTYEFDEITVVGSRPIHEVGINKTVIDSVALKENIALSMADILSFNSSIYVKSYGRASLSTVSFRGTSPSHTQVTWNGMRINNPMLGSTDFSTIPSFFIDDATLLHGSSSVNETGGGLGGAVKLATQPTKGKGFTMQFVQGIGSYATFDEFLRLGWSNHRWHTSTRVAFSTSRNDFKYTNRDKKINIYDEDMNIISQYHPVERNRSGSWRDLNILQEAYCDISYGDRIAMRAWYTTSNRELAMLTTDYAEDNDYDNRQRENTFRGVISWEHLRSTWKMEADAGYIYTWLGYDYLRDPGNGTMTVMTRSRSRINTAYGNVRGEYYIGNKWLFTADIALYQHFVQSRDKNIILQEGNKGIVGYNQARMEMSGSISAKWNPTERIGVSLVLREELHGRRFSPIIPALFIDGVLSKRGNVTLKASLSRNYRSPSLNDLYFLPGGNPNLRSECGWSYDAGVSFALNNMKRIKINGSATWFESRIDDWILWLPTNKGFFSPRNVKDVHSYGVELSAGIWLDMGKGWTIDVDANYSWTPSINCGDPLTPADRSVGKQLPYVPLHTATINGTLAWRGWSFQYKWCYYSERYTMTSNDYTLTGQLPDYYMSNIALAKQLHFSWADLSIKGCINNLFDEDYLTVLSRPMPGINFQLFVGITPKW